MNRIAVIASLLMVVSASLVGLAGQAMSQTAGGSAPIIINPMGKAPVQNKRANKPLDYSVITRPGTNKRANEQFSGSAGFEHRKKVEKKVVRKGEVPGFPTQEDMEYLNTLLGAAANEQALTRELYSPSEISKEFSRDTSDILAAEEQRFKDQMQDIQQTLNESQSGGGSGGSSGGGFNGGGSSDGRFNRLR